MTDTRRGSGIFRTKSVEQAIRDTEEPEFQLKKALGPVQLTVMGIGVLIGTGVFVLAGEAAALYSGPAVSLSFLISGVVCALAALCYAEFASTVPVAGSAYTFSYASMGEFIAWMIGWDLILEFTLGAATVAKGWSGYFDSVLGGLGITVPEAISGGPGSGGVIDLPAVFVALLMMVVLIIGIRLSAWVNATITSLKLLIVGAIIVIGAFYVTGSNWTPFIPPSQPADYSTDAGVPLLLQIFGIDTGFGLTGVFTGAALVFFAYLGFDIVATLSEEVKNPQRTMPIGILASLAIATVLYIVVSLIYTGILPYDQLGVEAPAAAAMAATGVPAAEFVISLGILIGLTVVIMTLMLGQTRVAFAMSRDHLLPPALAKVHPTFRTPYRLTIITGVVAAILGGFLELTELGQLVNIGTLAAFVLVSIGVIVLRRTRPDLPRAFKTPFVPVLPIVSALACLAVALFLPAGTWIRFIGWMVLGAVVYYFYGRRRSRLVTGESAGGVVGGSGQTVTRHRDDDTDG
ncbi:amino acid/polyamine/organocation transporter (APC superfamily) [Pseudonocardia sediminis]|uniref:Amino acid/polyamine/organocation transporter (APC superfamily) n=1 Tax=Pseudonocardia sediminis TaxID=1397368 RepID=A0A4Q7V3M2_PSEST|nr:amino acid permease [Pseudonocardia sediminis]RZT88188.1 amino acid/polyamine/organocation transporter (APC superfamily) [Pseudonocardia sediminis]